jgi:hypothetical protein
LEPVKSSKPRDLADKSANVGTFGAALKEAREIGAAASRSVVEVPVTPAAPLAPIEVGGKSSMGGESKPDAEVRKRAAMLTYNQVMRLTKLLAKNGDVIEVDGESATYLYHTGWSDERVRNEVNPDALVERVAEMRRDEFGPLSEELELERRKKELTAQGVAGKGQFVARIIAVEKSNTELRTLVESLSERLLVLEDVLAPTPKK